MLEQRANNNRTQGQEQADRGQDTSVCSIILDSGNLWIWAREEVIQLGDYGLDDWFVLGFFCFF